MAQPLVPYGIPPPLLYQLLTAHVDRSHQRALAAEADAFMEQAEGTTAATDVVVGSGSKREKRRAAAQQKRAARHHELCSKLNAEEQRLRAYGDDADNPCRYEVAVDATSVALLYMEVFQTLLASEHSADRLQNEAHKKRVGALPIRDGALESLTLALVERLEAHPLVAEVKSRVFVEHGVRLLVYEQLTSTPEQHRAMRVLASEFFQASFAFLVGFLRMSEFALCDMLCMNQATMQRLVLPRDLAPIDPHLFSAQLRAKLHSEHIAMMASYNAMIAPTYDTFAAERDRNTFRGCLSNFALAQHVEALMRVDLGKSAAQL